MSEIAPKSASLVACQHVRCAGMDTNESLRARAAKLVARGMNQKAIAAAMGMSPSTFNRWLHGEPTVNPPTVAAMDGFEKFVQDLREDIGETKETQRAGTAAAGEPFPKTGTEPSKTGH